jgi:hypothetical protein
MVICVPRVFGRFSMRLLAVFLGFGCALAVMPAFAQSEIGRPDPVEAPASEESAPTAPARTSPGTAAKPAPASSAKPQAVTTPAATSAAKPDAKSDVKPEARPAPKPSASTTIKPDPKADPKADPKTVGDLSPADRLAVQNALSWSGDFGASVDGEDPLITAIKNYQQRNNAKATGTLTPEERDRLIASGRSHETEVGWRMIDDAATGIRLGLPSKMLPIRQETRDGTLWRSRHGDVQVETFRITNGLALAAVFELEKTQPKTRKVEYSALRPDGFIISGLQGLRKFAVRAQAKNGDIRGFTIQYDQAMEGIVEPVSTAMANGFTPFPPSAPSLASAPARKVEYGSAVVVDARGLLVTDRRLTDGCQSLIAAGHGPAEPVANDHEFALLRIYGARGLLAATLAADAANGDVVLRGIPEPQPRDGNAAVKEMTARVTSTQVTPSPGAGFSGGGVFDAQGRLAGMTSVRPTVLASVDPVAPQATLLPFDALRELLKTQSIATPSSVTKPTILRLICVR